MLTRFTPEHIPVFRALLEIKIEIEIELRNTSLFSKHRPSGPMLSISRNVRLSVRPCVRLSVCPCVCSLLRYRLTVFLPPLSEVGCPIFLEIRNPWGKVMERSGLRYEHFCLKIVKNCRKKKVFFLHFFIFFDLLLPSPLSVSVCGRGSPPAGQRWPLGETS